MSGSQTFDVEAQVPTTGTTVANNAISSPSFRKAITTEVRNVAPNAEVTKLTPSTTVEGVCPHEVDLDISGVSVTREVCGDNPTRPECAAMGCCSYSAKGRLRCVKRVFVPRSIYF